MSRVLLLGLFAVLSITLFVIPGARSVQADAPVVTFEEFVVDNEPIGNCGNFLIISNGSGTSKLTTYFDHSGNPIRLLFQGRYRGTLTNSVTGFQITDDPSVANIFVDLIGETQTNVGAFFNITLPGEGVILFEVGRIVFGPEGFPIFIAGPHLPGDAQFDIICSALNR